MASVSLPHILIATALAAIIVALPMGHLLMIVPWIIVVSVACRHEAKRNRGTSTLVTYVAVTAVVVLAAILAPVKTADRVLESPLVLPKTELTLGEMDRDKNYDTLDWLPHSVSIASTPGKAAQAIRFRETDITLREFVETIEEQSNLRHRFRHCGNGSSILYGGDCAFGLHLRDP